MADSGQEGPQGSRSMSSCSQGSQAQCYGSRGGYACMFSIITMIEWQDRPELSYFTVHLQPNIKATEMNSSVIQLISFISRRKKVLSNDIQLMQHPHHKESSQPPQDNPSHSSDSQSLQEEQLTRMLGTLKKFKHILKKGNLTAYKKHNSKANEVFSEMSQFFHLKQKRHQANRLMSKSERFSLKNKRLRTVINQNSLISTKNELPSPIIEPEIIEDQSSPNFHGKPNNGVFTICHICRQRYNQVHPFYGYFCPSCATLNMNKRTQKADLSGLTALVTGGRIKIGYQIAIKLLRDGAFVYVSSRFVEDTVRRYQTESDYEQFKDRLKVIQCDFLSQKQVQSLIEYIKANVVKLDILINNAAQTIVRPKEFFHQQVKQAQLAIEQEHKEENSIIVRNCQDNSVPSLMTNGLATQGHLIDREHNDEFGQPLDLRTSNTWVQAIQDVSLLDCYTTQVINSIVPFHLISQLKCKMLGGTPSWIVNVSSMEGVFGRNYKSEYHPHTNMAKAALNMITRTTAAQFHREGIFMTSVDTGWVTNENPYSKASNMQQKYYFKCPLDCIDGAMRVLDPIYLGVLHKQFPFGCFLKNYAKSSW